MNRRNKLDYAGDDDGYDEKPKWFQQISPDPKNFEKVSDQILIELKDEAKKILDSEIANYNIKNTKTNPDYRWMKNIMSRGTVSDKIAAYTVIIQENPVCNLETIKNLVGMVKVGKKKECIAIIETLSELFISDLLRPNEKLMSFSDRPLSLLDELSSGNAITRRKYLSHWYFEDELKAAYYNFVQALNTAAHDTVESNKEKAISAMSKLLAANPEQEKNLLSHIINKMGDPSQKVASKAMYCLMQILKQHSNMQGVILKEIEKLLFRQNIGHKAQYYSLCFLSQFYLCTENSEVAKKLIEVYFAFFKKCTKESNIDSRMMSVLLIGVNRAYPYAKLEPESIADHIDAIYKIVHTANFSVSLNALTLLYQVSQCSDQVNDRFYSALYRKLLDPSLLTCNNQAILLNLIYKALNRDTKSTRIIAFIKRLLQIALQVEPNFVCGILFLVSQIISKKENVSMLEFKGSASESQRPEDDDDEDEKFTDVKDESDEQINTSAYEEDADEKPETENADKDEKDTKLGWVHRPNNTNGTDVKKEKKPANIYDLSVRNPLFIKSDTAVYVALLELKNHYHPSVRLFAGNIVDGETITYPGDPLKDFTLIRFLERFVFKNPKKADELPTVSTFARRKNYKPQGVRALNVFSNEYLQQHENNIPVEERFLYQYMQRKYKDRDLKEDDEDASDAESVASEDFEDMLSRMYNIRDTEDYKDIDYMQEVGENIKNRKMNKKKSEADEDSNEEEGSDIDEEDDEDFDNEIDDDLDDEGDMDDEDDDLEMNDDDRELLGDLSDDEDDTLLFDEDTSSKSAKKKAKKMSGGSVFASAEEFASMLEEQGSSKIAPGSSNQYSTADKAGPKQLDWEDKRNRWIKGFDSAVGKSGGRGKKRPGNRNQSGFAKKGKKFKK